jgi:hypothetical protein
MTRIRPEFLSRYRSVELSMHLLHNAIQHRPATQDVTVCKSIVTNDLTAASGPTF